MQQKFVIVSHVQTGFRAEMEAILMSFLVVLQEGHEIFCEALVSDQVVIHKKRTVYVQLSQGVQFPADLIQGFGSRFATEHDDDVAEFTAKWAAARELQTNGGIFV